MAIKDIAAAWKTDLTKFPPAERFYVDPRKQIYPPLSTGADPTAHNLAWWKVRKNGLCDAGNMPGSHHACIFKATTNLVADPEDLTTGNWANTNSTDALSDYYIDGKRFTKITATVAGGYVSQTITFTGNAVKAIQAELRRGDDTVTDIVLRDTTAAADRLNIRVTWATKAFTQTTGSVHLYEWRDDNHLLLTMLTTTVTAANTNSLRLTIPTNGKFSYFTAVQAEDSIYPTPYVNGSRAAAMPSYVLPMPASGKFTLRLKVFPFFAYDTAGTPRFYTWYMDSTHYFHIFWSAIDTIRIAWYDDGTVRTLDSQQFDDGSAFDDINQLLLIDAAIDLTTGSTAGSQLWINRVSRDTTWSGNIDAKTSKFPILSIGHWANGSQADSLFNQVILIPDYVATDADVQNDYRDVKQEQIVWHFNGEGCGRTRCNISRHVIGFASGKSIEDPVSRQQGANDFRLELENKGGIFSDDQYAAFNPVADNFNGLVTQKYLQKRCRLEAETWYGNNFELFFTGLLDENRFRRRSSVGELSIVDLSAEDMISIIGRKFKRAARTFENYKLSDPTNEGASLIHAITRLATKEDIYNFASNSSFENATIGNSWAASGGTLTRQAGGRFDSFCGQLANASGAVQSVIQTITYTGRKKLNVGEAWTFFIWLKSAAAVSGANAWLQIMEYEGAAYRASTAASYVLIGGEGFVMYAVTHVIADQTSDRLKILIGVPDTKTVQFDGAMLIQSEGAINYFVLNNLDGAAGVASADAAVCAGYNTVGFDVDYVNITHPWALVPHDEKIWEHIKEIGDACGNMYLGLDECGTLKLRAKLAAGYQDPASLETIASVRSVDASAEMEQANKLIGHAVKIVKLSDVVAVWIAAAAGNFKRAPGSGELISEEILNGAYWPDATEYPEYWAKYGTVGSDSGAMRTISPIFKPLIEDKYKPNEKKEEFVGLKNPEMIWQTLTGVGYITGGPGTSGLTLDKFDTATRADAALIRLVNNSGSTKYIRACVIRGKPIIRYSGDQGYIHDSLINYDDILENGEKKFEFGNNYIAAPDHLKKLADLHWKNQKSKRHIYQVEISGRCHWYSPGEWYTLVAVCDSENINAVCECVSVQIEGSRDMAGRTALALREVYQNWTFNINAAARFIGQGSIKNIFSYNSVKIASFLYTNPADYYCDGVSDEDEINTTIDALTGMGGGIAELTEGTIKSDGAIIPQSKTAFIGQGWNTIIEKNANAYAIDIQGTAGTYKENIIIRDMTITRNAADTNSIALIHLQYARNVTLENLIIKDSYGDGIIIEDCENVKLLNCIIDGAGENGVIFKQTLQAMLLSCLIASCGGDGCQLNTDDTVDIIDRGDCESVTAPMITPETIPYIWGDATWARSGDRAYSGSYSYKFTKTAGVTLAIIFFCDNYDWNDLHGVTPGKTYRIKLKLYIPSTASLPGDMPGLRTLCYFSPTSWVDNINYAQNVRDVWQELETVTTIPATATGVYFSLRVIANTGATLYVDEVELFESDYENNGYIVNNCTIKDNAGRGIYVATNEAQIIDNRLIDNGDISLYIAGGARNIVRGNDAVRSGDRSVALNFYDGGTETQSGL